VGEGEHYSAWPIEIRKRPRRHNPGKVKQTFGTGAGDVVEHLWYTVWDLTKGIFSKKIMKALEGLELRVPGMIV